jgi:hypothetical protein
MKFKYLIIILATLFLLPLEKGNALLAYKSVTTYEEKLALLIQIFYQWSCYQKKLLLPKQ